MRESPKRHQAIARNELHRAAGKGDLDACKKLVKQHPDFAAELETKDRVPLHCAAMCGHVTVVKLLLPLTPGGASAKNTDGWTSLHHAAFGTHKATVELLLPLTPGGALLRDKTGRTPADLARRHANERHLQHRRELTPAEQQREQDRADIVALLEAAETQGPAAAPAATSAKVSQPPRILQCFMGDGECALM